MKSLKIEDLEFDISSNSEGSVQTSESFQFCKQGLLDIYLDHLLQKKFRAELHGNVIYVNTFNIMRFADIKQVGDILIYPNEKMDHVPVTRFRIIVGCNAPTVSELVRTISDIQEKKMRNASEDSPKRLPYVIVFSGSDLSDKGTIEEYSRKIEGLLAVIWCNSSNHLSLQLAYSKDKYQKLEKEKVEQQKLFLNFLEQQNKDVTMIMTEMNLIFAKRFEELKKLLK